jgi:hypothetical protein
MFSTDVITAVEKYGTDLVNSVMQRAETVYRNFNKIVNQTLSFRAFDLFSSFLPFMSAYITTEALRR